MRCTALGDKRRRMTQFLGTHYGKFDAKGRLAVPAPFRSDIEQSGSEQVVFRLSHQRPCIEARTLDVFAELCAAIYRLPHFSEERTDLEETIIAPSIKLRLDSDGRVILPKDMYDELGFKPGDEIAYVGKGDRFEIWLKSEALAAQAAARARAAKNGLTLPAMPRDANPKAVA